MRPDELATCKGTDFRCVFRMIEISDFLRIGGSQAIERSATDMFPAEQACIHRKSPGPYHCESHA
jgi:transposase